MTIQTKDLLQWLPGQRWFGTTAKPERLDVVDVIVLDDGPPELVLALVRVFLEDGTNGLYQLPLLVDGDGRARDALEEAWRLSVLGELMAHGHAVKGDHGAIECGGPGLDPMAPPGPGSVRPIGAEQSNTSVVLDDRVILKLFRRVEPGSNPDLELCRLLTNEGFENVPPQVGELTYRGEIDGEEISIDLGVAQMYVRDASDGWDDTRRRLGALLDQVDDADLAEDRRFLVEERGAALLDSIAELGEATGALHVALSREETHPDLAPEPVEPEDLKAWADSAAAYLDDLRAGGVGGRS